MRFTHRIAGGKASAKTGSAGKARLEALGMRLRCLRAFAREVTSLLEFASEQIKSFFFSDGFRADAVEHFFSGHFDFVLLRKD